MIENYLQMGIRVKWTKPRDGMPSTTNDIVRSSQPASMMTYDGLDGELVNPQFMLTNVSTLGLKMGQSIAHDWLDYVPGGTAVRTLGGQDILTGWMSGCIIAKWHSPTDGTLVGHVGTVDNNIALNQKVKAKFRPKLSPQMTAFQPLADWPNRDIEPLMAKFKSPPENHVLGLVTSAGQFYSVLIFGIKANLGVTTEWCIGGIKRANVLSYAQLQNLI
jgi:hypothetical protein